MDTAGFSAASGVPCFHRAGSSLGQGEMACCIRSPPSPQRGHFSPRNTYPCSCGLTVQHCIRHAEQMGSAPCIDRDKRGLAESKQAKANLFLGAALAATCTNTAESQAAPARKAGEGRLCPWQHPSPVATHSEVAPALQDHLHTVTAAPL